MVIFSLAVLAAAETEADMVVEELLKSSCFDCQTHFKEFDETLSKDDYWRIPQWGFLTVLRHLSEGVLEKATELSLKYVWLTHRVT